MSANGDDEQHTQKIKCLLVPRSAVSRALKKKDNEKQQNNHQFDTHVTSTPMGVSLFSSSRQQQQQQKQKQQTRSRKFSLGKMSSGSGSGGGGIKNSDSVSTAGTIFSSGEFSSNSRRALSHYSKQRIQKSEISCPFRCSCTDLHLTPTSTTTPLKKLTTFVTSDLGVQNSNETNNLPTISLNVNNNNTNENKEQQINSNVTVVSSSSKTIGKKVDAETTTTHTFTATNLIQVLI